MPSLTWLTSGRALGRIYSRLEPVRRSFLFRHSAMRWLLTAGAVALVAYLGYLGVATLSTTSGKVYLGSGRTYSRDDLSKICRALDRQRVSSYQVDEERRVTVSDDQREQAEAAIATLDLGPRLPGEIRDQAVAPNWLESPHERESREHRDHEKIVESMIRGIPGIVGCFVRLDQPEASVWPSAGGEANGLRHSGHRGRSSSPVPDGADDHHFSPRLRAGPLRRGNHGGGSTGPYVS